MVATLLALHLSGAVALGVALLALIVKLWRGASETQPYILLAKLIAAMSSWQFASGLLLAVLSPGMSTLKVCSNIAIYWAMVFVAELVIIRRVQPHALYQPNR
ncbi:MAG: hypothetical protein HY565_02645 [Candidatus Kerfeldbacteria bacterium]|nr:hypothetical protein [Candidatus Kerfeldbacteria bacterium]